MGLGTDWSWLQGWTFHPLLLSCCPSPKLLGDILPREDFITHAVDVLRGDAAMATVPHGVS
jgi:hypothetical protein